MRGLIFQGAKYIKCIKDFHFAVILLVVNLAFRRKLTKLLQNENPMYKLISLASVYV